MKSISDRYIVIFSNPFYSIWFFWKEIRNVLSEKDFTRCEKFIPSYYWYKQNHGES